MEMWQKMDDPRFFAELDAVFKQFVRECETFTKDVVGEILDRITTEPPIGNPFDTGRSVASWTASVGSPIYNEAIDVTENNRISHAEGKSRSMATLSNLNSYTLGQKLYLANGTSYISELELLPGKSTQSVAFVLTAALRYSSVIDWKMHVP